VSGWLWAIVIVLALDAFGRPFVIGKIRTATEMHASVICDVLCIVAILLGGGVL
jgi:hypothetical protein